MLTTDRQYKNNMPPIIRSWMSEFIGVLRHMQQYFSLICDGTDVQADWRSCTQGRAPNAIDISQGSLRGRPFDSEGGGGAPGTFWK